MHGKVVLITGASSGVGLASARRLAGTRVAAELWSNSERLTSVRFPVAARPLTTQPVFAPSGGALKGIES